MELYFGAMLLLVIRFSNCKKRVIIIMSVAEPRASCRGLFRGLEILPVPCQYILSLMPFYICNKMLFWGVFPDRLKYATIKPLHKNEDRCEVSYYRPVSLLTSFSKIFETVMKRRILKHITNYNILSSEQFGFRLGLRTNNATYKLTTEI